LFLSEIILESIHITIGLSSSPIHSMIDFMTEEARKGTLDYDSV
jgi:hypothetical protein